VCCGAAPGGITGIHEWVFSDTPTGVHVATDESFAGEAVEADVTGMQSALDSSLISWLAHLKSRRRIQRLTPVKQNSIAGGR
jgi:hypothetical protein